MAFAARLGWASAILASCALPDAAAAQLAGGIGIVSDYRLRGLSLNGGRAATTVSASYDDESGFFAGAAATSGDTRRFGVKFLGHSEYVGYAERLPNGLSWEIGASNTQVYSNVFNRFSGNYAELFAGLSSEQLSARIFYSPAFLATNIGAIYVDVNGSVRPAKGIRLFAHGGLLMRAHGRNLLVLPRSRHDLRLGAAAELGGGEVQLAWVRSGADRDYLAERKQERDAMIVGISFFF